MVQFFYVVRGRVVVKIIVVGIIVSYVVGCLVVVGSVSQPVIAAAPSGVEVYRGPAIVIRPVPTMVDDVIVALSCPWVRRTCGVLTSIVTVGESVKRTFSRRRRRRLPTPYPYTRDIVVDEERLVVVLVYSRDAQACNVSYRP
jgi:hypothetical protein